MATGLLLAIPLILVLAFGPFWSWCLLVGMAAVTGLWELQGLVFRDALPRKWQILNVIVGLSLPLGAAFGGSVGLGATLGAALFAGFFLLLVTSPLDFHALDRLARMAFGWLYIPYLLSYVLLMGHADAGRAWVFFTLLVIVAGDSGAYYSGKRFGRRKLYPEVSPKKTIEGSIGGLLASAIVGMLFGILWLDGISLASLIFLSGGLALVGQVGDLIESMIKRMSGKKDSSQLLPGHGGLLDRLDSLLFVFPAGWFFLTWLTNR